MTLRAGAAVPAAAVHPDLTLRRCLGHFATGVTVVAYRSGPEIRGLTVNSFTSVSLDPPLVLVCVDKRSRAAGQLMNADFSVNVLHAQQRELAWHFAGKAHPDITPEWRDVQGIPALEGSLAWLTCSAWESRDAGDHIIVIGRVLDYAASDHLPLCFFRGEFTELAPSAEAVGKAGAR